jgi:hypothetical protein
MATSLQINEAFASAQEKCLRDKGHDVEAGLDGGVSFTAPEGLTAEQITALEPLAQADVQDCILDAERASGRDLLAEVPGGESYRRMLDTLECLVSLGYTQLGDPPSEESWVETEQRAESNVRGERIDQWLPYQRLYESNPDITEDEWTAAKATCPEWGSAFGVGF